MMVAVTTLFPASSRSAETVIGITVSGSAIVTLAAHAPVETDNVRSAVTTGTQVFRPLEYHPAMPMRK